MAPLKTENAIMVPGLRVVVVRWVWRLVADTSGRMPGGARCRRNPGVIIIWEGSWDDDVAGR